MTNPFFTTVARGADGCRLAGDRGIGRSHEEVVLLGDLHPSI